MRQCLIEQAATKPRSVVARVLGVDPLHPDAVPWFRRAVAELEVAHVLSRLGPGFTVLHAVPLGDEGGETATMAIDHLVVGPPGIFTITTTTHSRRAVSERGPSGPVQGYFPEDVREALSESRRAAELLRRASGGVVTVTPLIVVTGVESIVLGSSVPAVTVLPASRLVGYLNHEPRELRPEAVAYYLNAAEDRATWHSVANDLTDSLRITQRFERLREDRDAARLRRALWCGLAAFALFVGALATGLDVLNALHG